MQNLRKKLLVLIILIVAMCYSSFNIYAASYPTPSAEYNIYDLVRNTSKSGGCSDMTPQGITFAGDYLLISAYCSLSTHSSILYVFNESDKSYYGTIKLPSKAHVGGVAYDNNKNGNIWVSKGNAVGCFKYSELVKCKNKVLSISKYNKTVNLDYTASTMCYDTVNNYLWIAPFDEGFADCYEVNNNITDNPTLTNKFSITTPTKTVQGISVRGNKMIISSSYGRNNDSKLYSYTWNQNSKEKTGEKITILPAMSEGVVMGSIYTYIVYESVAKQYYDKENLKHVKYFAAYKSSSL